jgi:hypothetical protein
MTALAAMPAQDISDCPLWCEHEAEAEDAGLHQASHDLPRDDGTELLMILSQEAGEEPTIGLVHWGPDEEIFMTAEEAQKVGTILLQLAQAARRAASLAA